MYLTFDLQDVTEVEVGGGGGEEEGVVEEENDVEGVPVITMETDVLIEEELDYDETPSGMEKKEVRKIFIYITFQ